jgi:hypothetical protein
MEATARGCPSEKKPAAVAPYICGAWIRREGMSIRMRGMDDTVGSAWAPQWRPSREAIDG